MSSDLVTLGFRADSSGIVRAEKDMNKLTASGGRADKSVRSLGAGFLTMAAGAGVAFSAFSGVQKLVGVTRQFDVLNAQLITATGSAKNAAVAFEGIQKFAATTPYDLGQVTDSFTKLVNLGLTPSERALVSYGNTASSMGKSLNQLIEAVADASTGEFERLKEFGIKAKSEGDNVSFTFRGVTKTIKKEASEIESYLMALGENEFAGAMSQRIDTLDGKISNFGDSWDTLFLNISNQGVGDALKGSVQIGIDAMQELNDFLVSGQFEQSLDVIGAKFNGFATDAENAIVYVNNLFEIASDLWSEDVGEFSAFVADAFRNMPENIRAAIQLMAVEIASLVDYGAAYGQAFAEVIGVKLAQTVEEAKAYGNAIGIALNPFSDEQSTLEADLERLKEVSIGMTNEIFKNATEKAELTTQVRRDSIVSIINERDEYVAASDVQIDKVTQLGAAYRELQKDRAKDTSDSLKQFKIQAKEASKATSELDDISDAVDGLGGAWTRTGSIVVDTFGSISDAMNDYSAKMAEISKQQERLDKERLKAGANAGDIEKVQMKLNNERAQAEISNYRAMAGAAESMFSEKTAAAKAFGAINQVLAIAEIALSYQKMTASTTETGVHVANEATKQSSNALTAITSAFAAPFPVNFVAGAAMIGVMASLLGKSFGGGGGSYEMPEDGGTGTVLGDSSAQSNSIENALSDFDDIQIDQLAELRGIRNAMSGLAGGIERLAANFSTDLDFGDTGFAGSLGEKQNFSSIVNIADKLGLGSVLGVLGDNFIGGALSSLFGSTKKKLVDSGLSFISQTLGEIFNTGNLEASTYGVIEKTKKSMFGLSKKTSTSTEYGSIDNALTEQMADIFSFIGDSVVSAAESLGLDAKHIITTGIDSLGLGEALEGFKIDIGNVSFKDKTGEEIEAELNAIFSQQADLMTQYLTPAIGEYQKVGEGLFETLQRVSYEQALFNDSIALMGKDLSNLSSIMQIDVAQALIAATGGAEKFAQLTGEYFESFYSESEQLANLESSLKDVFDSLGVGMVSTREGFRDLVDGIDITTEEGRQLFAALLEINPAMADYIDALEDLANDKLNLQIRLLEAQGESEKALAMQRQIELEATDESLRSLLKMIWAQEDLNKARNEERQLLQDNVAFAEQQLEKARQAEIARINETVKKAQEAYQFELQSINAQREAYNALINELTDGVASAESALNKSLNAELSKYDELIAAANNGANEQISAINSISSARMSALNDELSIVSSVANRLGAASKSVSASDALAAARRGNFNPATNIATGGDYSSSTEAMIGAAREAFALDAIGKLADSQMSDLERSIAATESSAQRQIDAINAATENEVAKLEEQKIEIENQVKAILGVDDSVLSLNEAMAQYQAAQDALQNELGKNTLDKLQAQEDIALAALESAEMAAEEQIDALNKQVDELLGLNTAVASVEESIALLLAEREAFAEWEKETGNAQLLEQQNTTEAVKNLGGIINDRPAPIIAPPIINPPSNESGYMQAKEIEKMREEIKHANQSIAKSAATTAKILQRIEIGGLEVR